jgi:glycosyltransferase involved in cell wall biosynthesis
LVFHLRRLKPKLIHCASPKGVIYGGIAARLAGVPAVVFSVSGQGYMQTGVDRESRRKRLIRVVGQALSRRAFLHRRKRVIVQNHDDLAAIVDAGLARRDEVRLIPGSGVDIDKLQFIPMSAKQPIVLFPARMLVDKGLLEFADAARELKSLFPEWRFVLAGTADYRNPTSIDEASLRQWSNEGFVEWLGHVDDMTALYEAASIVCLPSYREGMPKSLLEGAAAGSAIVTTDVIGCREAIEPDITGLLVAVRDSAALVGALKDLILDTDRRAAFGLRGRQLAVERFSLVQVVNETISVYDELT